ncbi:Uncharacterised protein [Yersinia pekkanenii]|uniref:Uncharacterized protein n=1 Tax=Yersinia pekkanenii TaxID=1288385 RepID=A0A0T9RDF2_9GAMM|nr:Uncharacterised protein [Yersinia pekkanenii]CRY69036.1 Uncharacterised protein [Yersinia pekkanenii]
MPEVRYTLALCFYVYFHWVVAPVAAGQSVLLSCDFCHASARAKLS